MKAFKTNHILYTILILSFLTISLLSLLIPTTSPWFTLVSGLGCGGFASVLIAWLVDIINQKAEARRNQKMMDCVLIDYDIHVKIEMQRCLSICAKRYDIDINKSYNIEQIKLMLDEMDEANPIFEVLCDNFCKMIDQLQSISVLFFEKSDKGIKLFRQFERIRGYAKTQEFLKDKDNIKSFAKFIALQMIEIAGEIDTIREDCKYYQLSDNDKKYIISFRESKNKTKEEQNASN